MLQWGRNFCVAEIESGSNGISTGSGFNGAATFVLRKLLCGIRNAHISDGLQWGRNFCVAEIKPLAKY